MSNAPSSEEAHTPGAARIAHPFVAADQQRDAASLGMWIFLSTETLLFGGMFFGYAVYRLWYPEAFLEAGRHTILVLGAINTAVLLVSSFLVALAVHRIERGGWFSVTALLWSAAVLGGVFLAIKGFEYAREIDEGLFPGPGFHIEGAHPRGQEMFFVLYFTMTALHAAHVLVGMLVLGVCGWRVFMAREPARLATTVDLAGLYWHFVDVIWIFLFPLFYLVGRAP
jgi:cytochrome c oxidase subunit 3